MLKVQNSAGIILIWPDYSDYIEVYDSKDRYCNETDPVPLYVLDSNGIQRTQQALQKLANKL